MYLSSVFVVCNFNTRQILLKRWMKAEVFRHVTPSQPIFFSYCQCRDWHFFLIDNKCEGKYFRVFNNFKDYCGCNHERQHCIISQTNLTMRHVSVTGFHATSNW